MLLFVSSPRRLGLFLSRHSPHRVADLDCLPCGGFFLKAYRVRFLCLSFSFSTFHLYRVRRPGVLSPYFYILLVHNPPSWTSGPTAWYAGPLVPQLVWSLPRIGQLTWHLTDRQSLHLPAVIPLFLSCITFSRVTGVSPSGGENSIGLPRLTIGWACRLSDWHGTG